MSVSCLRGVLRQRGALPLCRSLVVGLHPPRWPVCAYSTTADVSSKIMPTSDSRSAAVEATDSSTPEVAPPTRRRRRSRHKFDLEEVPSFEAFQQQQQTRALYRQFMRLAYGTTSRGELVVQIRHEFKQAAGSDDPWAVKRAFSEGGRRYKELAAMLSSVPSTKSSKPASPSKASPTWPWQTGKQGPPLPFPKR
jgi:hypothetical protein